MATVKRMNFRSTLRYLATGAVPPGKDKTWADGSIDQPGTPGTPVEQEDFPTALTPWIDGLEDPTAGTGLLASNNPSLPEPDAGAKPIVGAYEGAVRTEGPASYWPGQEVSGGPYGDQARGSRMMFKLPVVMSEPDNPAEGQVTDAAWADELAAALVNNGQGDITDSEVNQRLLLWQGDN